jgi:outer membrane protein, heavy metal efflux system
MLPRLTRSLLCAVGLLALAGCFAPVQQEVDHTVCGLADHLMDPEPLPIGPPGQNPQPPQSPDGGATGAGPSARVILPVAAQAPAEAAQPTPPSPAPRRDRLKIPPELPGANAPQVTFPPAEPKYQAERERVINELFPPLPELGPDPQPAPGPSGHPLTLSELQHLALSNSPVIRQRAADVRAAEGAAKQAGAYPNPTLGYEADTAGTGGTAGYQGMFFDQTIKTGGKLKLNQAMAVMDVEAARVNLRRAQSDLATQVRAGYFAVLVAQENMRVTGALVRVTDEAYRIQLLQFRKGGIAAYYEPAQLRSYAFQARGAIVQARNVYVSAWKQLAAALGLPGLPPTELAGRIDMPAPAYDWDRAVARVLTSHTDVVNARVAEQRARYNLRLQQITPVPDVNLHLAIQKDYTTPPFSIVSTMQLGLPVPLWDQNKGAIAQAQAQLLSAVENHHAVRDDLYSRLAEAFQRYRSNLTLLEYYRNHILPDQVRFYRGVYARYGEDPGVSFADVVNAQQALGSGIATYITTLGAMWTAVTDVANLLQTDDLFAGSQGQCVGTLPDLGPLFQLPCVHPCSPLPDPALKGADRQWPALEPVPVGQPPAERPRQGEPDAPREGAGQEFLLPLPARQEDPAKPTRFEPGGPTLEPDEMTPAFALPAPVPAPPATPSPAPTSAGQSRGNGGTLGYLPPAEAIPALPVPFPTAPAGGGP